MNTICYKTNNQNGLISINMINKNWTCPTSGTTAADQRSAHRCHHLDLLVEATSTHLKWIALSQLKQRFRNLCINQWVDYNIKRGEEVFMGIWMCSTGGTETWEGRLHPDCRYPGWQLGLSRLYYWPINTHVGKKLLQTDKKRHTQ